MDTYIYEVVCIDGDYAHLKLIGDTQEPKLVARALLPEEIREGSRLRYECFEYELM